MKLTPESRLLLRIAARIVPAENREEWGREWESELWYWLTATPEATLRARLELSRHCMGAIVDAFYLRVDRDALVDAISRKVGHPALPLLAALMMLLAIGASSGWFAGTRRAIKGPDYPDANRVALLYQAGPLIGEQHSVPAAKIESWDREATSLQGAAAYFWYRTIYGIPARETLAAKVGPAFFQILGVKPALGRVFRRTDAQECRDCAVLSYDSWRSEFRSDPDVVGRSVTVDGQPARVIGVLPRHFWFMDEHPAVWTLYVSGETWRGWDVPPAGGICRLRPGIAPAVAQAELRATASPLMPRATGRWATITLISIAMRRSLPFFLPMSAVFLGVAVILSIFRGAARRAGFGLLTATFSMAVLLASVLEFTEAGQPFAIWWFIALSIAIVYCSFQDSRVRCPVCLRRLTMPVRIGHVGQVLLEKSGTELVCPNGHGMLYTPEMHVESESWARV